MSIQYRKQSCEIQNTGFPQARQCTPSANSENNIWAPLAALVFVDATGAQIRVLVAGEHKVHSVPQQQIIQRLPETARDLGGFSHSIVELLSWSMAAVMNGIVDFHEDTRS